MSLVDLKTNLKDLKYSHFQSQDPYVVKDINDPPQYSSVNSQVNARVDDLERISKRLGRNQRYVLNQAALRLIDSQNQIKRATREGRIREIPQILLDSVVGTGRAVGSMLSQVPVQGTGTHYIYELRDNGQGTYLGKIGGPRTLNGQVVNDFEKREDSYLEQEYTRNQLFPNPSNIRRTKITPNYTENRTPQEKKLFRYGIPAKGDQNIENRENLRRLDNTNINFVDIQTTRLEGYEQYQILPFEIAVFDPKRPNNDIAYEYLYFRAYIDSLSDQYNGTWEGRNYIGRAEPLYVYTGFGRDMNLTFKIGADNKYELIPLYNKLNRLVGTTSPSYNSFTKFMRGVFVRMTIGDYIKNVPGFFSSINLSWNTTYPWEIGVDRRSRSNDEESYNDSLLKVPHILDVDLGFTPIHTFNPEYGEQFISNREDLTIDIDQNRRKLDPESNLPQNRSSIEQSETQIEGQDFNTTSGNNNFNPPPILGV